MPHSTKPAQAQAHPAAWAGQGLQVQSCKDEAHASAIQAWLDARSVARLSYEVWPPQALQAAPSALHAHQRRHKPSPGAAAPAAA